MPTTKEEGRERGAGSAALLLAEIEAALELLSCLCEGGFRCSRCKGQDALVALCARFENEVVEASIRRPREESLLDKRPRCRICHKRVSQVSLSGSCAQCKTTR